LIAAIRTERQIGGAVKAAVRVERELSCYHCTAILGQPELAVGIMAAVRVERNIGCFCCAAIQAEPELSCVCLAAVARTFELRAGILARVCFVHELNSSIKAAVGPAGADRWHPGEDRQEALSKMPEREETKLVLSTNERIMSCIVGGEDDIMTERWELSSPIPGVRIINTWQVYHLIWLALAQDEAGHYLIYRSIDLQKYRLVHDHSTEIYNLFWLDDGHVLFSAADGCGLRLIPAWSGTVSASGNPLRLPET